MSKYAYVSLLASNNYIYAAIALMYSGKNTYSKYPFYLLVTKDITAENKKIAQAIGFHLMEINEYVPQKIKDANFNDNEISGYGKDQQGNGGRHVYSKLLVFGLTQFDKVCFIDLDSLVLHNMDEIFSYTGYATVHWNHATTLNTAMFIAEPNKKILEDLLKCAENTEPQEGLTLYTDYETLNTFFNNDNLNYKKGIPSIYYYDFGLLKDNKSLGIDGPNIKAIHFGGQTKPGIVGNSFLKENDTTIYMEYMGRFYLDLLNNAIQDINLKKISILQEIK